MFFLVFSAVLLHSFAISSNLHIQNEYQLSPKRTKPPTHKPTRIHPTTAPHAPSPSPEPTAEPSPFPTPYPTPAPSIAPSVLTSAPLIPSSAPSLAASPTSLAPAVVASDAAVLNIYSPGFVGVLSAVGSSLAVVWGTILQKVSHLRNEKADVHRLVNGHYEKG